MAESSVAGATNFNDVKLLDGSFQKQSFGQRQPGETIDIAAIVNANIDALGEWKTPLVNQAGHRHRHGRPGSRDTFAAIGRGDWS